MAETDNKVDAWMPLWIGAYLADTMKLTTIQHGAYFLLLISYWRERQPLADDDEELRSITKTEKAEWKRMRPVLAKFFKIADGLWTHKRVEQELAAAGIRKVAAVSKAKAAAEARWGKGRGKPPGTPPSNAPGNPPSDAPSIAPVVPEQCPTPSPSPNTPSVEGVARPSAGEACKAMRSAGLPDTNPSHPGLIALLDAGLTVAELVSATTESMARGKASFAYVLKAAEGRRRDAAAIGALPAAGASRAAPAGRYAAAAQTIFGSSEPQRREDVIDV